MDSTERITVKYRNQEEHDMGRMKGLAAILGAAMLVAVVAACGNGAEPTSLSDQVSTPAPPTEIPLTQVIEMARSGDLQSIEVSGDKLEVRTLRGETFASRKEEGRSMVELLYREGVDQMASGLQITVKGSAARERGSTSAGQTTVTLTPTATPTSDEVSTPAPGQLSEWYEETQETVWPIEFVMKGQYALGEDIEIKIGNSGTGSYVYSEYTRHAATWSFMTNRKRPGS